MNILLLFHCASNTGYAIGRLERVFDNAARKVTGTSGRVHYAYQSLGGGLPHHLSGIDSDVTQIHYRNASRKELQAFQEWLKERKITLVFGFDLPVNAPVLSAIRASGVKSIISYWGASISGVYPWYLRPLRRIQYVLARHRPDHYIFESSGMLNGALYGAAIPASRTTVCRLGVDCDVFAPLPQDKDYVYRAFNIPTDKKIVFFSGHMEPRKGVHVLLKAFLQLVRTRETEDVHLLLLGNTSEDKERLLPIIKETAAQDHVTFGGYRHDVPRIHHGIALGVICSTGWDSFTMSSIEISASGIPLIVSDLPGLSESVVHGETGEIVEANNVEMLCNTLSRLLDDEATRVKYGAAARKRATIEFSEQRQISHLAGIMQEALRQQ
jgi:glycosyltransferase involved in cell wall biosynthesis